MTAATEPSTLEGPLAKLAARLKEKGLEVEPEPELEEYMAHAEFERDRYQYPTDCGGMLMVAEQSGPVWMVVCSVCGFTAGVPMQKVDPARVVGRLLERAGLPEAFAGKAFDRDDPAQEPTLRACRLWLRSFKPGAIGENLPAVGLYGKAGRGKSHLLALMIETLVRTYKIDAMYRSAAELFDELQAGMDSASYEIRWQRAQRVKVLALDDLGAGRMTDWRRDRIMALVDYRYSKEMPLLLATNIPPDGWDSVFGERTASRLKGMVVRLELKGPDRRAQQLLPVGA